jgi:hypothetical protein
MAKDGKNKKKGGKARIPKEIGGVKVPKKLRKLGGKAVKAASDPVVSEVVAGALLAAAEARIRRRRLAPGSRAESQRRKAAPGRKRGGLATR